MIRNFENLSIWKKSRALVKQVYILARNFPPEERFSLVRQIKRCGISIPSNIAEGCGRRTNKELIYFLDIAIGSLCELETQLYLSYDLDFFKKE